MKWIVFLILLVPLTTAATLQDFPDFFDNEVHIVVGDMAKSSDSIAAVEIATSLQDKGYETVATLASDIEDPKKYNLVSIGGACVNSVTARLYNFPQPCYDHVPVNGALIQVFSSNTTQVVAAGMEALDTRRAARVLREDALPDETIVEVSRLHSKKITVR